MRALITNGPRQVDCVELATPENGEGNVLISFEAGLFTVGTRRAVLGNAAQVVGGGFRYPLTLGGTALGRVIDPGASARFARGDRVLVSNVVTCGSCQNCRSGADNLCLNRQLAGIECDGTFSQVVTAEERRVFPVADDADSRLAVLVTEVAVLVNALEMGWHSTEKTDRVVVIGAGSLGIHAAWLAREWGAIEVHVVDPRPDRLELARQVGADVAMAPKEYDDWVNEKLRDRGAGIALVVTDHVDAIQQGCRSLRARGCVVCVGLPEGDIGLVKGYYPNLLAKELVLRGCYAKNSGHIARALELLRARGGEVFEEYVEIPISEEGAQRLVEVAERWPDGRRYVVIDG